MKQVLGVRKSTTNQIVLAESGRFPLVTHFWQQISDQSCCAHLQVTHEPHFCLLREVVSFSGGSRGRPSREVLENPCQESFILFQIGLLREYLELEFRNDALPFAFNVERVIDDFVLFCMLIGNDFLPGMPTAL